MVMIRCSGCGQWWPQPLFHPFRLFHGVGRVLIDRAILVVEADDGDITLADSGAIDGCSGYAFIQRNHVGSTTLGLNRVVPGDLLVNDVGNLDVNLLGLLGVEADEVEDNSVVAIGRNGDALDTDRVGPLDQ